LTRFCDAQRPFEIKECQGSVARAERGRRTWQPLTSSQRLWINDDQNSLKVGARGPSLLEDCILREKITHFDHERIPERVVYARGGGTTPFLGVQIGGFADEVQEAILD